MNDIGIVYPPELPVSEHREEILAALCAHPVVIICGDTGSGKTSQLPKMALELASGCRPARIAVTQPRRLAAVTMAERVADELGGEAGGLVGYRHRYAQRTSSDTRIVFMTDGVLLAETRSDPLLKAYDTIIVDEAHERSLNIDFLLGILKRILTRRRDLHVIVSSATIDSARFSAFFGNAPTVNVPGRLFPVTIAYRPPPEDEERDLARDVAAAVNELPARDDILVFLPGERDIRETADFLTQARGGTDDILPLLASLPASEQRRAFQSSPRRRIILATNVAETSVTIPGIRAVIDSGLARISRYIHRTQVQRLQIEPISQASARQRAGRCGRLGPGTCLRLYSEADFAARDAYTPPEVLRSSLAGVILTMLDLRLGDIESFPFLDPPKPTMIREGLLELLELGAIHHRVSPTGERTVALTDIGRKLARIPVEPRLARMLLAASENAVLPAVLPLVAAQACDDPRRRPIDDRERADQAHARFRVDGSDFLGTLALWDWWRAETEGLSQSKARKLCKTTYLSYPKMREWRELTRQLETLAHRLGLFAGEAQVKADARAAAIHRALLSGLLGRIGHYDEQSHDYRGAHAVRFALHPGSVLAKAAKKAKDHRPPEWVMAGELVDTARLFARDAAVLDPSWIEPVAGAICKRSYHSPEWDGRSGFVRATEQVTLYGLVIVPARRCDYSRINPTVAREIFLRFGLIGGDFPNPPPAVRETRVFLDRLRRLAEKSRRSELFDVQRLIAHFDQVIPDGIVSAPALVKWLRTATPDRLEGFRLKREDWIPASAAPDAAFPDSLLVAGVKLSLSYRHAPDDPERDGVTCSVRKSDAAVLRLWRHDWLVPGLLGEKLTWMLACLPGSLRRLLAPFDQTVAILLPLLKPGQGPLYDAVREAVSARWGYRIAEDAWNSVTPPPHLRMRFLIRDDRTGRPLAISRDLDDAFATAGIAAKHESIVAQRSVQVNAETFADAPKDAAIQALWPFGDLKRRPKTSTGEWSTEAFPALHDENGTVVLRLHPTEAAAARQHALGVTRLFALALEKTSRAPFRVRRSDLDAALYLKEIAYDDERIADDIFAGAVAETYVRGREPVLSAQAFAERLAEDRSPLMRVQSEISAVLTESAAAAERLFRRLEQTELPEQTVDSLSTQLSWLLYRGFPRHVPLSVLRRYKRYLKGAEIRLERARISGAADLRKEALFAPHWQRYANTLRTDGTKTKKPAALADYRWMLEEYRVSLFAQELHTPEPVSPRRLDAKWTEATG